MFEGSFLDNNLTGHKLIILLNIAMNSVTNLDAGIALSGARLAHEYVPLPCKFESR